MQDAIIDTERERARDDRKVSNISCMAYHISRRVAHMKAEASNNRELHTTQNKRDAMVFGGAWHGMVPTTLECSE